MQNPIPIKDEFTINDVGASLLNELSKSLYDPEHVIREYLQNAIDAHKQMRDAAGIIPPDSIGIDIVNDNRLSEAVYGGHRRTEPKFMRTVC